MRILLLLVGLFFAGPALATQLAPCSGPGCGSGSGGGGGDMLSTNNNSFPEWISQYAIGVPADHQVLLATGAATALWKSIGDCSIAGKALTYSTASHAFGCNTITGTGSTITVNGGAPISAPNFIDSDAGVLFINCLGLNNPHPDCPGTPGIIVVAPAPGVPTFYDDLPVLSSTYEVGGGINVNCSSALNCYISLQNWIAGARTSVISEDASEQIQIGNIGNTPSSVVVFTDGVGDGEVVLPQNSIGRLETDHTVTLASNPVWAANDIGFGVGGVFWEGATGGAGNAFEALLGVQDPTFDRRYLLPDFGSGNTTACSDGSPCILITNADSGSVTNTMLAANSVGPSQIQTGAVGVGKIAAGAVGSTEIADHQITATDIAAGTITGTEIADGQVGSNDIAPDAITNSKMADDAIGNAEMQNASVGSAEIIDGQVFLVDLAPEVAFPSWAACDMNAPLVRDATGNPVCWHGLTDNLATWGTTGGFTGVLPLGAMPNDTVTAGRPLLSGGPSAVPAYGNMALSGITDAAIPGKSLVSGGATADPNWGIPSMRAGINLREEFCGGGNGANAQRVFDLSWFQNTSGTTNGSGQVSAAGLTSPYFCLGQLLTGTNAAGTVVEQLAASGGIVITGNEILDAKVGFDQLSTGTTTYDALVGFCRLNGVSVDCINGYYFRYDHDGSFALNAGGLGVASPNWIAVTEKNNNSTGTATDTGVPVTAGQANLRQLQIVVNSSNTSVQFFIDGTLVATHSANLLGGGDNPSVSFGIAKSTTDVATPAMYLDYLQVTKTLSALR